MRGNIPQNGVGAGASILAETFIPFPCVFSWLP